MRIGIAGFYHETNTFALEQNDRLDARLQVGQALLDGAHPRSFIGGFCAALRERAPGAEAVPAAGARFRHGGLIAAEVFEHYRDEIVSRLNAAGPLDAVYFALHGAAVAAAPYTDAEGELLKAARRALGDEIPFVATYDFHAIMSDAELQQCVPFPHNTNPHIDGYERGLEAAGCLLRILRGQVRPVTRRAFVPILGPNVGQSTWSHDPAEEARLPLHRLNRLRRTMEEQPGVLNVSILGGYGYGDTPHTGMSVLAVTDDDAGLAWALASELAGELWAARRQILEVRPIHPLAEGVRMAVESEGLVLLVDTGDDPGSACPADSPAVLASLLEHGARHAALTIRDPAAVEAALAAGVGAELTLDLGAGIDDRFYQPLRVTCQVKTLDDGRYTRCGPTHGGWGREPTRGAFRPRDVGPRAVLRVGDSIDVIVHSRGSGKDRDFFKSAGILMEEKRILAVKSNQAHRASFDPIVDRTIQLNTPGVSTVDYASLPYRHLPRPSWPLDRDFDYNPQAGQPAG